jgi:MtN3 and saliva related transmembrane protein
MPDLGEGVDVVSLSATLGLLAASLTTLCWIPQAWRTLRSSDTAAISLAFQVLFALGLVCWIAYGWAIDSLPVVASNAATLVPVLLIVAAKVRRGRKPAPHQADRASTAPFGPKGP